MNFDFSGTANPKPPPPMALRTVYRLHADPSYDIRKCGVRNNDVVAIRTVGGLGKITVDGSAEIAVGPGSLLFVRNNMVRRYYCCEDHWDFWWFEFSTSEETEIPMNRLLDAGTAGNEAADCRECLELLRDTNPIKARQASACFAVLFCKWMLNTGCGERGDPNRSTVEDSINYMRANLDKPISVGLLAQMSGLSERRFRQVFILSTGIQPKRYLENLRIGIADELLANTPFTINEISLRLGYSSQFHFSKAFHRFHGVSPSQFRKGSHGT
jgi:AraC family transcriptional regulator of arabinose operon